MNCSQLLVAVPRVLARRSPRRRGSAELCDVYIDKNDSQRSAVSTKQAHCGVLCCETRVSGPGTSQLEAVPNEASRPAATRTGAKARRRAERHSCKTQSKTSYSAVESTRPKAPIPATVGQVCFTVRQTQRLGLSVRSNARTPTSQWESRQTAALRASTRAPRRARRSLAPPRPDIWREASLAPPRPDI